MKQHQFSFFSREEESFGSCDPCKKAHQKCDRGRPSCERCSRMKISCMYLPLKRISSSSQKVLTKATSASLPMLSSPPPTSYSSTTSSLSPASSSLSPGFAFSTKPSYSPTSFAVPAEKKDKKRASENVSLLFASSMEGFSKTLGSTITSPEREAEERRVSKTYYSTGSRNPSDVPVQTERTQKKVFEVRRVREANGLDYNPKRLKKSPPVSEEGGDDLEANRLIYFVNKSQPFTPNPSSSSDTTSLSPSLSLPVLPSITSLSRPIFPPVSKPSFASPSPLSSASAFSPLTNTNSSPYAFSPSPSASPFPHRSPYSSYSPDSSPFEPATTASPSAFPRLPSLFTQSSEEQDVGAVEDAQCVEEFNRMLEEKEVLVCDDIKIQLFYDVGWLRQVRMDGNVKMEMDEESLRQCDLFDNAEFQQRWVEEQTSPTFFLSDPFVLHDKVLRMRPLRVRRVNAHTLSIWNGSEPPANKFHPTSQRKILNDICSHAISPSASTTTTSTFPVAVLNPKGHWIEYSAHALHFYGKDGILRYLTRILKKPVAPLRAMPFSNQDEDSNRSSSHPASLPSLRAVVSSCHLDMRSQGIADHELAHHPSQLLPNELSSLSITSPSHSTRNVLPPIMALGRQPPPPFVRSSRSSSHLPLPPLFSFSQRTSLHGTSQIDPPTLPQNRSFSIRSIPSADHDRQSFLAQMLHSSNENVTESYRK